MSVWYLPTHFRLVAMKREDLVRNHTTDIVRKLHGVVDDQLILEADRKALTTSISENFI